MLCLYFNVFRLHLILFSFMCIYSIILPFKMSTKPIYTNALSQTALQLFGLLFPLWSMPNYWQYFCCSLFVEVHYDFIPQ